MIRFALRPVTNADYLLARLNFLPLLFETVSDAHPRGEFLPRHLLKLIHLIIAIAIIELTIEELTSKVLYRNRRPIVADVDYVHFTMAVVADNHILLLAQSLHLTRVRHLLIEHPRDHCLLSTQVRW